MSDIQVILKCLVCVLGVIVFVWIVVILWFFWTFTAVEDELHVIEKDSDPK